MGIVIVLLVAATALAQSGSQAVPRTATTKELMLDMVYPAANDILLFASRGSSGLDPADRNEWDRVRRSAVTLAESGNSLMMPGRAFDQRDWMTDARMLVDSGMAAYKAAQDKDPQALAAAAAAIDSSCTACHKRYRPTVFPRTSGAS